MADLGAKANRPDYQSILPSSELSSYLVRFSCSNGSIFRRTPLGNCTSDARPWALVIGGDATIGAPCEPVDGDVFFGDEDTTVVKVGRNGISILLAYADGKPEADLLRDLDEKRCNI